MTQAQDQATEAAIQATGKRGTRVYPDRIQAMMDSLVVKVTHIENTTVTVAVALLPLSDGRQFMIGIGHSACIDPSMFDADIGAKVATDRALAQARDEAWKLEGYVASRNMEFRALNDTDMG